MTVVGKLHSNLIFGRRVRVLSGMLADLVPPGTQTLLDIGCGSGQMARLVNERRPEVQITGIDSQQLLDQALEAVRTFKPLTQAEVASLLQRTRSAALEGKYELYKTSTRFDGTQQHPEWLGEGPLAG